jgi:phosphatidylglycerol:prolipoprotein diacylglycerol transferase
LIGYGALRIVAEFAREPDDFLGLLSWHLSMGQWLSIPMVVLGLAMLLWLLWRARKRAPPRPATSAPVRDAGS